MGQPQVSHLYFPAKTEIHYEHNIPHPQHKHMSTQRGAVPESCNSQEVINNKSVSINISAAR